MNYEDFIIIYRKKYNLDHVWVEKMICGTAVNDIFQFIQTKISTTINPKSEPKEIFSTAIQGKDKACIASINLFMEILATETANMAIRILPFNGVYLAG